MAIVTGPLLSIHARGKIAKSIVFAAWRGVKYARQYIVPANPRSTAQVQVRGVFAAIDATYKRLLSISQAPWIAASVGRPFVARNKLISVNLPNLRLAIDKTNWEASPGTGGGLPAATFSAATGTLVAGDIVLTATFPTPPIGWTLTSISIQALENTAPNIGPSGTVFEATDLSSAFPVTISVTTLVAYVVSIWPVWVRSDGKTVYGPSLSSVATAF